MSPFGLFELLKTLLPTPDQTTQPPPASVAESGKEQTAANPSSAEAPPMPDPAFPDEKTNACAEYLYRHEQRAQGVKTTKKRLD